ncbi:MAG: MBL fold metallo-hydrolase [Candidatus Marinimicrobia bacterium]|jgi:glyoxylase-like metal-dependent hydrolase (beta-lactamase superfamily II)|nr:MBL fold metallo-hydrolase [Candidatus Neomarinimicrobiota bacterium]MCK9483992.1 MBL fold metallo-hydrolase [Candidatus Neomarinimicrobiota bacterium]MCK9558854.1 MBL fold metallo-hydrolase [Candidatus Neomarinimicrobiota bacterium]MDD5060841.1 MBL fold metallo-hydrolase [Candidatus Neomarinimicrobiota bacterium]MDD5230384.1 MBL fold metallo-hydrolase [Candidatus Neomarinimicrobiota bacterium]
MLIEQIITRQYGENVWLVGDPLTGCGLIIDPGGSAAEIIGKASELKIQPLAILNTHAHPDHLAGASDVQKYFDIPFYLHEREKAVLKTAIPFGLMLGIGITKVPHDVTYLVDEELFEIGAFKIKVITTPGHTPGGVCYLINGKLFSGDTLFRNSIGRTDFPGGSWQELKGSLEKLKKLAPETEVYPGHGISTTIQHELRYNPYMKDGELR